MSFTVSLGVDFPGAFAPTLDLPLISPLPKIVVSLLLAYMNLRS
jgi:hypothetical protein